jgi:hypothetical protein
MSNARLQLPSSFRRCRPEDIPHLRCGCRPPPARSAHEQWRAAIGRPLVLTKSSVARWRCHLPSGDGCEAAKISWCSERNRCGDEVGLAQSDMPVTTITRPALSLRISTVIVRNIAKCCGQALHEQVRRFATEKTDHRRRRLLRFRRHRLRRRRAAQGGMNWWRKSFDHLAGVHQEAFRGY